MMATLSLSPKRALEKLRQHRHAVAVLALHRAKKAVERELRSKGIRTTLIRPAEISLVARDYLAQHQERLRAEAEHAIATWPGFAHWRLPSANIKTNAQSQNEPKSTTSALQILDAK